ncbi:MAG: hypothetical protein IH623_09195 [Verrucomicrobia bacterium]|nr:hypothetical protein [Verrucomicrobiota bacterium]
MNWQTRLQTIPVVLLTAALLWPNSVAACTICYGDPESPLSRGLTWGITVLLGTVGMVLAGVVAFFVFLARKAASVRADESDVLKTKQV